MFCFRWYDPTLIPYLELGKEYSRWFSTLLGKPVIFGAFHSKIARNINPEHNQNTTPNSKVNFSVFSNIEARIPVIECPFFNMEQ